MITDDDRRTAATLLATAESTVQPIAPLSEQFADLDVEDAYAIPQLQIADKLARGRTVRGHKVGLSAKAMQEMLGVDEPDYGHLLDDMVVPESEALVRAQFCHPRVEPEVAFVLREPLVGPDVDEAAVLAATDHVVAALEIIDSRIVDWRITLADTIADNASSGRVVLGARRMSVDDLDVSDVAVTLRRNDEILEAGTTAAVLGNPATSVAWLANKLHGFGVQLDRGHVIMPGSCTRAVDVEPGDVVVAEFAALGSVRIAFS
jgi:2-keto-4-pentenoate hydratase